MPEAVPVRERVPFPPPMFVRGSPLDVAETVVLEATGPCPDCTDVINVGMVDPWKFEGTVGIGTFSPPLRLCVPLIVRMDRGAGVLDCAALRPTSQNNEGIVGLIAVVEIFASRERGQPS